MTQQNVEITLIQAGRQSKIIQKTRFHFLIENESYDYLDHIARSRGLSIAAVLNELLRNLRSVPRGIKAP